MKRLSVALIAAFVVTLAPSALAFVPPTCTPGSVTICPLGVRVPGPVLPPLNPTHDR